MRGRSLARLNPLYKTVLVCLVLVPFSAAPLRAASGSNHDWDYEETRSDAREFTAGGFVHVRLSVGDMHIKRGDTNKISLRYTIKAGARATSKKRPWISTCTAATPPSNFTCPPVRNTSFDVELVVPQKTNLDVHAKVGDVTVEEVEGDKDLSLGVGDIRVANGHAGYRLVNASTGIGDVNSDGYDGETKGWLGKTLKYHGDGKYELRAHVGVGDINLEGK